MSTKKGGNSDGSAEVEKGKGNPKKEESYVEMKGGGGGKREGTKGREKQKDKIGREEIKRFSGGGGD